MNEFPIQLALSASDTLAETIDCLTQHISLDTQGACTPKSLFQILIRSASKGETIDQTTRELKEAPCSNKIRYHLGKINDFNPLEKELNLALINQLPQGLRKKKQALAIDLNLIPYYGEPSPEEAPYIYRSQAKNGTCSFYAQGKRISNAIDS